MAAIEDSPMTPERWINNLVEVANDIADRRHQEARWLAPDALPWEHPYELIDDLDAYALEHFIEAFRQTFSPEQGAVITQFRDDFEGFCSRAPQTLDSLTVLSDPDWEAFRQSAWNFARVFNGHWPRPDSREQAEELLRLWTQAYAAKSKQAHP